MTPGDFVRVLSAAAINDSVEDEITDVVRPFKPPLYTEDFKSFLDRLTVWFSALPHDQVQFVVQMAYEAAYGAFAEVLATLDGSSPLWDKEGRFELRWRGYPETYGRSDSEPGDLGSRPASLLLSGDNGPKLSDLLRYDTANWRALAARYERGDL